MDRHQLVRSLSVYQTAFGSEQPFIAAFLDLLRHPDCYQRTHLPGHITGSAWIVTPDLESVLLVQHAKLKRWLQPGGHADGDENVLRVALREAEEETGLTFSEVPTTFFDIDIHSIPARGDFPQHDHYDIRFLLKASRAQPLLISEESTDLQWIPLRDLEQWSPGASMIRMRDKLLGRHQQ